MKHIWIAFGLVLSKNFLMMSYSKTNLFPVVIALYGLGLFVTGGLHKFKPLIIVGILSWTFTIISVMNIGIYISGLLALAVLAGYILPGHILKRKCINRLIHFFILN